MSESRVKSPDLQQEGEGGSARVVDETTAGRGERPKKAKKEKKVYEAGGVIVYDGKVVLRLTDEQRWIFPKGKLKKHESPMEAAIREAVEETGLQVEVLGDAGEFVMKHEGKRRRFAFYLMRATDETWDWSHHEGRDTFLMSPEQVGRLVRRKGYGELWEQCRERVIALCSEAAPARARDTFEGSDDDAASISTG